MKEFPVVYQDFDTDEAEYAFIQADNAIALWAELDLSGINSDLPELGPDFDIDMLGIKNFEIDVADKDFEADEDEVPEARPKPKVVQGEVYILGNHRLMCGDSTAITDVERLMNGEKADMVFTDPPYNHASEDKGIATSVSKAHKKLMESEWDKNFSFLDVAGMIESAMGENCTVYICTSHHLFGQIQEWMKLRSNLSGYCVWSKPNPMPSLMKRHWTWSAELICYATYGKHTFHFPESGHALSVWEITKKSDGSHPTQKPIEVCERAILHSSNQLNIVLDLFGGSGSTLIACEKTDRKCFMMELDPIYCGVILDRWQKFTGKKADREDGVAWDEIKGE
jgi:DNA modification methylase